MGKVWLKHKSVGDREFEYDLIDVSPNSDDDECGYLEDREGDEAQFNRFVETWLNWRGASLAGDRWFGDEFEWTLVDRPPEEWLEQEVRLAEINFKRAIHRLSDTRLSLDDYYPYAPVEGAPV
jgi:hypothetical protein